MKSANPIPDPLMSRRGNLYSLKGLRRLMAALAAMEKPERKVRRRREKTFEDR